MSASSKGRYAVFGNPVSHSKSPQIHTLFAQQFDIELEYVAIEAPLDDFAGAVQRFRNEGGKGCNVTVPFKHAAWELADRRSGRAELAGAVNTLRFEGDGKIFGDNTDGIGLVRDLTINLDTRLYDQRVLVVGAGGAVRGILGPLLEQAPRELAVANRTPARAQELAQLFATVGPIRPFSLEGVGGREFDLVINGTAASLTGTVPELPDGLFATGALAYDLMYSDDGTPFLHWARDHGAGRLVDGLGMLVEQAAESFALWHGLHPDTGPVFRALRPEVGD
jgi:shikimate dehydrogenase